MMTSRHAKLSLVAISTALVSSPVFAAGFQLNAQSATGIGRAFAGDAVIADNASVMARNPAAMALFDQKALSLGFEAISTDISVTNANANLGPIPINVDDVDDVGDLAIAPNIHMIVPINEKFAVGFNAYSNFGTKTEFHDEFYKEGTVGSLFGGLTDVKSANFGIASSYRINDQWSVGAGLDAIYGIGTLKRGSLININEATGWGLGFNLGTVFELDENNRFGLGYHYSPEIEAKDGDQTITLPLPSMLEFSGYHRINQTPFAIHYSIQYNSWSDFDKISFDNVAISEKEYMWQDSYRFALGGTYYLNADWTLRAGYMYDTSAQDEMTSISVPDSDRQWFSGGFTYHISQDSNIDFGLTYLKGEDVRASEQMGPIGIEATTRANAILAGIQYSHSF